ncbi:LysR family transcriptional regulator [Burkholderia sp. Bp9143]|uniref:LysR substrate-binding domain-containing protein n=1 Tax=Burkholderia sp. Bp9143 TaxID=2184574 RepID=UPI000F5A2E2F|nr:LysR substrate-binding domain-containing protein [Burkholderia sp. Bp9143]RQR24555.1 LysR family transcriptional regulator [Burkholderia sp. Bp9143]
MDLSPVLIKRPNDRQAITRLPHLSLLLAFKTVAEEGSFTRAADILHLSQSAVSQQVVRLEEALGVQLFVRSTRAVSLTSAGNELLNDIRGAFEQLVTAFDRCARKGEAPTLHVEAEPVLSAFWLTPRLRQFTQRYPGLQIKLLLTTHRVEFPREVELAIKWGDGHWPGFESEFLMGLNYAPVCCPTLMKGTKALLEPSDLRHQQLLHDRSHDDWERWQKQFPNVQLCFERGHIVTDSNVLAQMAVEGHGVALCALELIEPQLRRGELVTPFPDMTMRHWHAYHILTRRHQALSEVATQFIGWLKAEARTSKNGSLSD